MATWVGPPRSFTSGRPRPIQYVVIHATAGSEGTRSAEAGAAYDKTRTDGTSTHVFADTDSLLCEVRDGDQAHAARRIGNAIGLQLEICGGADQTAAQWADALSAPTLVLAARQTAEWCRLHGIPVRRLSVAETRAAWFAPAGQRPKGIVGHVDVTKAYPEDAGTHYDPGPAFPWQGFLQMVAAELDALNGVTPPPPEDDMEQTDPLRAKTSAAGRTVGDVLGDLANLRSVLWLAPADPETKAIPAHPAPGSLLDRLDQAATQLLAGEPPQVDAAAVAAALAADAGFLAALAKAVNDDAARRLES